MNQKSKKLCPNCKVPTIKSREYPPDMSKCPLCPYIATDNIQKADSLFAVLSVSQDGNEGICATKQFTIEGSIAMPMVAMRRELLEPMLTPEFISGIKSTGNEVVLAEFKRVRDDG